MSITWYKLKIKKQTNEYECYIRFKFDFQMQSIKIKSFVYLTDSEGNLVITEKKNKLGYDPRILGSLTVEKMFLNQKRNNSNSNNKPLYYEVMKYQGNFNICNLPLIDEYFRNGKALIFQYKNMIYLMDNKKYKIQMSPKIFTLILDVNNYGYISLQLFNKLEDVEKQELIFLQQNEDALCHRYISNKFNGGFKYKKDSDEIEIIEENRNFNQLGGRICIGDEPNENNNNDDDKDKKDGDDFFFKFFDDKDNIYEENSENSSVYDYKLFNGKNKKLNINNNKFFINSKIFNKDNQYNNNTLYENYENSNQNKKINKNKSKSKSRNSNDRFNINNDYQSINNENSNNFFIKLKANKYSDSNSKTNPGSAQKEFFDKAKNIINNSKNDKNNNINNNQDIYTTKNIYNQNQYINDKNNKNFNLLQNKIINKKTKESLISNETERKILLCSSGFDNNKYCLKLLYKSTIHGDNILDFHKRCDNKKNTFIIILTLDNQKFGFYTSIGLSKDKKIIFDNMAFLFKLNNAEMDCFHIKNSEIAFYGYSDYILYLGGEQLVIRDKFLSGASSCGAKMKNYKINSNYQINNGNKNFIIKELEVYIISEI